MSKVATKAKAKPVAKTATKTLTKTKAVPAKKPVAKLKLVAPVAKKPVAKKVIAKPAPKAVAKIVAKKPVAKAAVKIVAKKPATKIVAKTVASKTPAKKIVAKAAPVKKAVATKPVAKTAPAKKIANDVVAPVTKAVKTVATKATAPAAANQNTLDYKVGDMVVYPAHGVGQVEGIEKIEMMGQEVTLYAIHFTKDRMRLKLPLAKVKTSGLRKLASTDQMAEAMTVMKGRARIRRVMWSRRAQEYEAKINSGNPVAVAEVLRDLRRNVTGVEQSYSERQIFQSALERLASELAAIEKVAELDAAQKLEQVLRDAA